jgi:hypothetical protein
MIACGGRSEYSQSAGRGVATYANGATFYESVEDAELVVGYGGDDRSRLECGRFTRSRFRDKPTWFSLEPARLPIWLPVAVLCETSRRDDALTWGFVRPSGFEPETCGVTFRRSQGFAVFRRGLCTGLPVHTGSWTFSGFTLRSSRRAALDFCVRKIWII